MFLSTRYPSNILPHNQQTLPEKWEKSNFKEQVHQLNKMGKGRIGELTRKPVPKKENLREGSFGVFG